MKSKFNQIILFLIFMTLLIIIPACKAESVDPISDKIPAIEAENPDGSEDNSIDASPLTSVIETVLPAEPQAVSFTTSDGFDLNGIFYPASLKNQPLVILMHWAPGDQNDWVEIAFWLQNRGLSGLNENAKEIPWLDQAWFPVVDAQDTFNVFTFTFRNCESGCKKFEREAWYRDVQAAVEYAYGLDQINQEKIIIVGASIGSDGAVDGCAYMNMIHPDVCKGAISFSPGNYLTIDFGEIVAQLGAEANPKPVWCFYSESDLESANVCSKIKGNNYQLIAYPGNTVFSNGHGMNLITPLSNPNPLAEMLEFFETNF